MLDLVESTIFRYNMIPPGAALGVAVSGGADSVFLLHALIALSPRLDTRLSVIHIDHALRGRESDEDRLFVEALARDTNLPLYLHRMPPAPPADNLEQHCRRCRHDFFSRLIAEGFCDVVATGHTSSDQAETVLMRLLRGASPSGLRGVLPVTKEGIVRPLLHLDRSTVRACLSEQQTPWQEDSSNSSQRFLRNRVRAHLLPALRAEQPSVDLSLQRLAASALRDYDYWSGQVEEALSAMSTETPLGLDLDTLAISSLHPALQYRVLHAAATRAKGSSARLDQSHLDALSRLLAPNLGSGSARLPGLCATRSLSRLLLHTQPLPPFLGPSVSMDVPCSVSFGPFRIETRLDRAVPISAAGSHSRSPQQIASLFAPAQAYTGKEWNSLDWERIRGSLSLRSCRPGDHFHPAGSNSGQPLKNIFQKARIPLWERRFWPIITDDDRIVWIAGFGPAAPLLVRTDTSVRLLLRWSLSGPKPEPGEINFPDS